MKMAFPCLVPVGKKMIKHIYGEQYMGIKICKHIRFHKNAVMKIDISRKNRSKFENCDESSYIFMFN